MKKMLFIGGTRDGQRIQIAFEDDCCALPVVQQLEPYSRQSLLSASLPTQTEIYVKKDIWKRGRYIFSVMVKDGSKDLLNIFLVEYNQECSKS